MLCVCLLHTLRWIWQCQKWHVFSITVGICVYIWDPFEKICIVSSAYAFQNSSETPGNELYCLCFWRNENLEKGSSLFWVEDLISSRSDSKIIDLQIRQEGGFRILIKYIFIFWPLLLVSLGQLIVQLWLFLRIFLEEVEEVGGKPQNTSGSFFYPDLPSWVMFYSFPLIFLVLLLRKARLHGILCFSFLSKSFATGSRDIWTPDALLGHCHCFVGIG